MQVSFGSFRFLHICMLSAITVACLCNFLFFLFFFCGGGQATIAGLEGSGDIVSVSCTENEIFFLKGDRNIIRISSRPEGLASIGLYLL